MGLSNSSTITKIKDIPKELDKIKAYIEKFVIDYNKKIKKIFMQFFYMMKKNYQILSDFNL